MTRFVVPELQPLYNTPAERVNSDIIAGNVQHMFGTIVYNAQQIGDEFEIGRIPYGGIPFLVGINPQTAVATATLNIGYEGNVSLPAVLRSGGVLTGNTLVSVRPSSFAPIKEQYNLIGTGLIPMPDSVRSIGARVIATLAAAALPAASAAGYCIIHLAFVAPK